MQRAILNTLYRNYSNVSKSIKSESRRNVNEDGKIVKKYNSENKSLFGGLVETARQRKKRLPRDAVVTDISALNERSKNKDQGSELWWWDKAPHVTHIKFKNHKQVENYSNKESSEENLSLQVSDNHYGVSNSEKICASELSDDKPANPFENIKSIDFKSRDISNLYKSSLKLPSIIVKNITTFPLENGKKAFSTWSTPVSEIMSLNIEGKVESEKKFVLSYPSVTKILSATMSEASLAALQKWKDKLIAQLGEEGFKEHQEALLACGKMFHSTLHRFLSGSPSDELFVDPSVEGSWHSLKTVINDVSNVKVLESHVVHTQLMYRGFVDCIAMYKDEPLLIEWKKSDKQKCHLWNTYDAPLQLAAYLGALNFDNNYDFKVRRGLVVVAYTDGSPAHVHKLGVSECQKYWRAWLERLHKYWNLVEKKSAS